MEIIQKAVWWTPVSKNTTTSGVTREKVSLALFSDVEEQTRECANLGAKPIDFTSKNKVM